MQGLRATAITLILVAGQAYAAKLVLASSGKTNWTIFVERGATPSMLHGAHELHDHLAQITGADFRFTKNYTGQHQILVLSAGKKLGDEGYRIEATTDLVSIYGGKVRGAMYGCYAFLERLGCRWYTARVSKVPHLENLAIAPFETVERPAFEYREPFFTEAFDRKWASRNRINGDHMDLDESVGGKVRYGKFVHTFAELVSPTRFDETPDLFSMVGGLRRSDKQLCLTNPEVLRIAIDGVRKWIADNPGAKIFSVSQNDTDGPCECENCKLVEQVEGSPSGSLLRFVNAIAREIGKDNPDILIDTLAYQWSEKPPAITRPLPSVRIRLALIGACFGHGLQQCEKNQKFTESLDAWAKVTNQLYIWHYCTNFANYLQPLPDLDEISLDVKRFRDSGVVGLFYQGGYAPGGGSDMAELKSFVLARLMWNPDQSAQKLIDEFLHAVYGAAAPMMRKWLNLTHGEVRQKRSHARIYDPPEAAYLGNYVLAAGEKTFNEAETAVAGDVPRLKAVQRARLGLTYVQFMRQPPGDEKIALGQKLLDGVKRFGVRQLREAEPLDSFLKRVGLPPNQIGAPN